MCQVKNLLTLQTHFILHSHFSQPLATGLVNGLFFILSILSHFTQFFFSVMRLRAVVREQERLILTEQWANIGNLQTAH